MIENRFMIFFHQAVMRQLLNNTQDNNLSAIFFQDKQMRSAFEHYPEVILVDSTYKANNLGMPLYFIISVEVRDRVK